VRLQDGIYSMVRTSASLSTVLLALITIMIILALDADHSLTGRTLLYRRLTFTEEAKVRHGAAPFMATCIITESYLQSPFQLTVSAPINL